MKYTVIVSTGTNEFMESFDSLKDALETADLERVHNAVVGTSVSEDSLDLETVFYDNKNGSIQFDGATYYLQQDAYYSDRVYAGFDEIEDGEQYPFEMTALAIDNQGNEYQVSWEFWATKDEDEELDSFDYDDVCSVELI